MSIHSIDALPYDTTGEADEFAAHYPDEARLNSAPAIPYTITYSRETKDYDVTVDGQYVGSRPTYHAGETLAREVRYELASSGATRTATELDGGSSDEEIAADVNWNSAPATACKRDTLGNYWTICRADAGGACMCDVVVVADPTPDESTEKPPCPNCGGRDIDYSFHPCRCRFCDPIDADMTPETRRFLASAGFSCPSCGDLAPRGKIYCAACWESKQQAPIAGCQACSGPHTSQRCPDVREWLFADAPTFSQLIALAIDPSSDPNDGWGDDVTGALLAIAPLLGEPLRVGG